MGGFQNEKPGVQRQHDPVWVKNGTGRFRELWLNRGVEALVREQEASITFRQSEGMPL